jgi:hypothetical protein
MTDAISLFRPGITRDDLERFQAAVAGQPQAEFPVEHSFANGMVARAIFIPKHGCLVGAIHKFAHFNFVSKGDISVVAEGISNRVQAGWFGVGSPGTKRAGFAHEDTVWITVERTDETDLVKIYDACVTKTHAEYLSFADSLKLEKQP